MSAAKITRQSILEKIPKDNELGLEPFESELFGTIMIREWTGAVKDRWEAGTLEMDPTAENPKDRVKMVLAGSRALMFILSVCDENGQLLFSESDVHVVGNIPARQIDPIIEAIRDFNGISESEMKELVGNSPEIPS